MNKYQWLKMNERSIKSGMTDCIQANYAISFPRLNFRVAHFPKTAGNIFKNLALKDLGFLAGVELLRVQIVSSTFELL